MKIALIFLFIFAVLPSYVFAGATPIEGDDTVTTEQEPAPVAKPKPRNCPPADKNAKIVSAVQFFDHIRDNEGCRLVGPDKLTINERTDITRSIEADLASPHTILFHCNGKPTLASNTSSEAYMYGGNLRLENKKMYDTYFSPSENRTVTAESAYTVKTVRPFSIHGGGKILKFRRVRITETGENAIEIMSKDYPLCPDGSKESALLLPLQMS